MGSSMQSLEIEKGSYQGTTSQPKPSEMTQEQQPIKTMSTEATREQASEPRELLFDEATGLQLYTNELELNFMEQLQLRIINERKLDIEALSGEEYGHIIDYLKLEKRKRMLNDFADSAESEAHFKQLEQVL